MRRASQTLPGPRYTFYYRSRKAEKALLRHRIKEIAAMRVRYDYRLYCLEGLQMRHKPPRRWVSAKLREDRTDAVGPNQFTLLNFGFGSCGPLIVGAGGTRP